MSTPDERHEKFAKSLLASESGPTVEEADRMSFGYTTFSSLLLSIIGPSFNKEERAFMLEALDGLLLRTKFSQ